MLLVPEYPYTQGRLLSIKPTQGDCTRLSELSAGCHLGTLRSHEKARIRMTIKLTEYPGIELSAKASTRTREWNVRNNSARFGINALPARPAKVSLTMSAAPDPVEVGAELTYTLVATNAGPGPAYEAYVLAPVPSGATLISVAASGADCSSPPDTVRCHLGRQYPFKLVRGQTATIMIVVRPKTAGELASWAFLDGHGPKFPSRFVDLTTTVVP